ncbi:hypothetical protein LN650_19210 [Klebsiella pneumoniae subsp. pneumoniae]|nr:hypothetical protein [Klebsiella pneumoniae subsp. pneumoniae]
MGIRLDASTIETLNGFKAIGGNVYNGTLGIMSLMAPFFIGSALAEERKVDPMAAGLLAVAAFMTVTPYRRGRSLCGGRQLAGRAEHHLRDDYRSGRCGTVHLRDPSQLG